jgi:hypothetical protein
MPEYDTLTSNRHDLVLKCGSLAINHHGFGRKTVKMAVFGFRQGKCVNFTQMVRIGGL